MSRSYTVILHRAEDGWWVANIPMLHATAQGKTRSTALKRAQSLTRFAIDTMSELSASLALFLKIKADSDGRA